MSVEPSRRDIVAFALRALGWSIVFFAAWHVSAKPVSMLAAWGAAGIIVAVEPVERVLPRWREDQVVFDVEVDGGTAYRNRLPAGTVLEVPVDPRKQTYGLAFFLALLLASRARPIAPKALAGAAALALLAAVGVASEIALQLGGVMGPSGSPLIVAGVVTRNIAALGFQLGTLIFPTVAPVMLWAAMDARLVKAMAGRLQAHIARPNV